MQSDGEVVREANERKEEGEKKDLGKGKYSGDYVQYQLFLLKIYEETIF